MPTNSTLLNERFSEIRSVAAAAAVVRILDDLSREPSSKRFVSSRANRAERWQQLAQIAQAEVEGLAVEPVKVRKPARKMPEPKVVAASVEVVQGEQVQQ